MKNPKEFFWQNGKKTFCVMNELAAPECRDGSEPLSMHHETFSRFHFVLFNEDKKAVTANIPVSQMPGIFSAIETRLVAKQVSCLMGNEKTAGENKTGSQSPAFTTPIRSGKLKGLTPAGALIKDAAANKPLLENQISWLRENLGMYPANIKQIEAIEEALRLYAAGNLSGGNVKLPEAKTIIYPGGFRPLVRRKRPNGKAFVYSISISMYDQEEKPIEVTVRNFYAPVITTKEGLYNVMPKDREDDISVSCSFSQFEWEWFRHQAEAQMRTFEDVWAPSLYKIAIQADKANKAQAGLAIRPAGSGGISCMGNC